MRFYSKLNKKGEAIFKGGNVEPMSKGLIEIEAKNKREAESLFFEHICETLGSSMLMYYDILEVE